jgi:paraquat-inducible protein A
MPPQLIACPDCDLLYRAPASTGHGSARCQRCGAAVFGRKRNAIERTLALTIAGLILFIIANLLPFLAFEIKGSVTSTTLSSGVVELYLQGNGAIACLVLLTTILAPALQLVLLLYILVPLQLGRVPRRLVLALRALERIQPWSMMEVFLIGILVALVKLADMGVIITGLGIWSFGLLIFILAGAAACMDDRLVWQQVEVTQ